MQFVRKPCAFLAQLLNNFRHVSHWFPPARHDIRIKGDRVVCLPILNECKDLWLLKNSIFFKTAEIWGIENV